MSESDPNLLARWRAGDASEEDLFRELRPAMTESARRGIHRITSRPAHEHDANDAVFDAFEELFLKGPEAVERSLVGFAKTIAYRRGMDVGRSSISRAQADRGLIEAAERQMLAAADHKTELEHETLRRSLAECMPTLTAEQIELIEARHHDRIGLKELAGRNAVSYEATRRKYNRGMASLRRCMGVNA